MKELDSLQRQLAREDDLLSTTEGKIDSARQKIESLRQQIEKSKQEIQSTEELIDRLRANSETIKKRRGLLLQYIELAKSANDTAPQSTEDMPTEDMPTEVPEPEAAAAPSDEEERAAESQLPSTEGEAIPGDLPYLETDDDPDLEDLPFVEPPDTEVDLDDGIEPPTVSFDDIDEVTFTHEILPHTETFGEELLLVLAYHRKATAPKNVVRVFRRLDYAPKQPATEKNVSAQAELNPHLYQYAAGGRIALTREGRSEALRLLGEML